MKTSGSSLLSRPPFMLVACSFLALVLAILLLVSPTPHAFWESLAPTSFARYKLGSATTFMGALPSDEVGIMEEPVRAFRIVARSPKSGDIFRDMTQSGSPAGRLFGLAGLALTDSSATAAALARLRTDSATVDFADACMRLQEMKVAELAAIAASVGWASRLRDSVDICVREPAS